METTTAQGGFGENAPRSAIARTQAEVIPSLLRRTVIRFNECGEQKVDQSSASIWYSEPIR
jgi:hypothetical protein